MLKVIKDKESDATKQCQSWFENASMTDHLRELQRYSLSKYEDTVIG